VTGLDGLEGLEPINALRLRGESKDGGVKGEFRSKMTWRWLSSA
jgi:hypothetical protein